MALNYTLIVLITLLGLTLTLFLNKEKFVMDSLGNIPSNLFIEKRIPSNNIPTIDIILPSNRIYNPLPNSI